MPEESGLAGFTLIMSDIRNWLCSHAVISPTSPAMPSDFGGAFAPAFETAFGYLDLLSLAKDDAAARVRQVKDCCKAPSAAADVKMLIGEMDWRANLVAVVAAFFLPPWSRNMESFWKRLDSGSWVAPQIAVGLSIMDPDFSEQCRVRLEAHCPLDSSELESLDPGERHSLAGPAGFAGRSAKAANSLSWLAARIEPTPGWLAQIVNSPEHLALIASDLDEADQVTADWHGRITEILGSLDGRAD